jgi:hypothetical protein
MERAVSADAACQRWGPGGRESWRRRRDGGFNRRLYEVREIWTRQAKPFVEDTHYLGSMPSDKRNYGLFEISSGRLVGVAVLSTPTSRYTIPRVFPELDPTTEAAELGRFVLLDEVPANAESWFLGQVREQAARPSRLDPAKVKPPLHGLVMFSDPVARRAAAVLDSDGTVIVPAREVTPGHVGTIYQASGCEYLGLSGASTEAVLPDGTVFGRRTMQKIRAQEQGHRYAEERLISWGARPMRPGEKPAAWLREALGAAGARKFRHPGKHEYGIALGINAADRADVVIAGGRDHRSYPKRDLGQLDLFPGW